MVMRHRNYEKLNVRVRSNSNWGWEPKEGVMTSRFIDKYGNKVVRVKLDGVKETVTYSEKYFDVIEPDYQI